MFEFQVGISLDKGENALVQVLTYKKLFQATELW